MREFHMELRHLVFLNKYLNIPCYEGKVHFELLKNAISHIGRAYGSGKGDDTKKGIRYIALNVGCSKRQVKLMLQSVASPLFKEKGASEYVLRCHVENYCRIYGFILERIVSRKSSRLFRKMISEAESLNVSAPSFSDVLILKTVNGLEYVEEEGVNEQIRKIAIQMNCGIKAQDKKYDFSSIVR